MNEIDWSVDLKFGTSAFTYLNYSAYICVLQNYGSYLGPFGLMILKNILWQRKIILQSKIIQEAKVRSGLFLTFLPMNGPVL